MQDTVFERPLRKLTEREAEDMNLQYYDSELHAGAFVHPRFARKVDYHYNIIYKYVD